MEDLPKPREFEPEHLDFTFIESGKLYQLASDLADAKNIGELKRLIEHCEKRRAALPFGLPSTESSHWFYTYLIAEVEKYVSDLENPSE